MGILATATDRESHAQRAFLVLALLLDVGTVSAYLLVVFLEGGEILAGLGELTLRQPLDYEWSGDGCAVPPPCPHRRTSAQRHASNTLDRTCSLQNASGGKLQLMYVEADVPRRPQAAEMAVVLSSTLIYAS